jgi:hypothetical protein
MQLEQRDRGLEMLIAELIVGGAGEARHGDVMDNEKNAPSTENDHSADN